MSLRPLLVPCLCVGALIAGEAEPAPAAKPAAIPGSADELTRQASYLVGAQMAQAVRDMKLDLQALIAGLTDRATGKPLLVARGQLDQVLERYQAALQKNEEAAAAKRKAENPAWLAENAKKPGFVTTKSGLQYRVITAGTGKKPADGQQVSCSYALHLRDGTLVDASDLGEPAQFAVGQLIPGWNEALQLMQEGSKWELVVPPELGYGEHARLPIGGNQILLFQVELHQVVAAAAADEAIKLPGVK